MRRFNTLFILYLILFLVIQNGCSTDSPESITQNNNSDEQNDGDTDSSGDNNSDDTNSDNNKDVPDISFEQVGNNLVGNSSMTNFGNNVALDGDGNRLVVANSTFSTGNVSVFEFNGSDWIILGNSITAEPGMSIGGPLNINDLGTVIGFTESPSSGTARIYEFIAGDWQQKGSDILAPFELLSPCTFFSMDMDVSGNRIILGLPFAEFDGVARGAALIYNFDGEDWVLDATLRLIDCDVCTLAGNSQAVAISGDGNTVAVGSETATNGISGYVSIYNFINGEWVNSFNHRGETLRSSRPSFNFDGSRIAIGGPNFSGQGQPGVVEVFDLSGGQFTEISILVGEDGQEFGQCLALSDDGERLVVKEPLFGEEGMRHGKTHVFFDIDNDYCLAGESLIGDAVINNNQLLNGCLSLSSDGKRFAISSRDTPGNGDLGLVQVFEIID